MAQYCNSHIHGVVIHVHSRTINICTYGKKLNELFKKISKLSLCVHVCHFLPAKTYLVLEEASPTSQTCTSPFSRTDTALFTLGQVRQLQMLQGNGTSAWHISAPEWESNTPEHIVDSSLRDNNEVVTTCSRQTIYFVDQFKFFGKSEKANTGKI